MNRQDHRRKYIPIACLALLLAAAWTGGSVQAADSVLALDLTVVNPTEEAQDVAVETALPGELTKEDILSTDGLDLRYDTMRRVYVVSGAVPLGAGQTSVFKIRVRDIWLFSPERLARYRQAVNRLPEGERARAIEILDRIEREQERPRIDPSAHIAFYRERVKELEKLDPFLPSAAPRAGAERWGILVWTVFAAAVAGWVLARFLKTPARPAEAEPSGSERRRAPRLLSPTDVECRLLMSPDGTPAAETLSLVPRDLSEGGVCLEIPEPYRAQSVLELRIKLPSTDRLLVFRGTVAWQKRVVGRGRQQTYMTGIQLGEASYEDYRLLKDYMGARLS